MGARSLEVLVRCGMLLAALTLRTVPASVWGGGLAVDSQSQQAVSLPETQSARPAVVLRAASGATIPFMTQNGGTVEGVPSQAVDLPYLVLYRNGALTRTGERTLIVELSGVEVPALGVTVTLQIETQHVDPDSDGNADQRFSVWRESRRIARPWYAHRTGITVRFVHEFGATVVSGGRSVATPTDYFRYEIALTDADHPPTDPLHTLTGDYAFLMENQWVARLPEVREASPGAAPDELVVYYCDMFPFRKGDADPDTWLPRAEVRDYVGAELLPQMVETHRIQTDEWGFPWTDAWTSYRAEDPERLSVALGDGRTWFHGPAPSRGSAEISIKVTGGDNAEYDTLTDGILSTFHHELFHNLQRSLNLYLGGDGRVGGEGDRWKFFTEGTAVLASSVGQPLVHLGPSSQKRAYMTYANRYVLWGGGRFQDLVANYDQVDPYYSVLYWRFLFEQCGGLRNGAGTGEGVQDPAAGMQIVRRALTILYAGDLVNIASSADLIGAAPDVLDQALAGSSCPFQTYRDSLVAFSRALYELRLEGGRCTGPDALAGCGFFDPHAMYSAPSVSTIAFAGVAHQVRREMMAGFGTDLVDVLLDPAADGQAVQIEFHIAAGDDAELDVQILPLLDARDGARLRPVYAQKAAVEILAGRTSNGHLAYVIPEIRTANSNMLGLVITRLDAQDSPDPMGEYTIVLQPATGPLPETIGDTVS